MAVQQYASTVELRDRVGVDDTGEDGRFAGALLAASRSIDSWCHRRFWVDDTVQVRTFEPVDQCRLDVCAIGGVDVSTSAGLIVKVDENDDGVFERTLTINTDFRLEPTNAPAGQAYWPSSRLVTVGTSTAYWPIWTGRPTVEVTAKWGWTTVPEPVREACLALAVDVWKSKDVVFGQSQQFAAGGVTVETNAVAATLLAPFRHGVAVAGMA